MRNGKYAGCKTAWRRAGGFTYVSLIILVAIIALIAATTVRLGVTLQRAQAERDLLHVGEQFSDALKSYASATPAGQPQQPATLQDLLKDPRFPGIRRHLRKIFVDPMTGKAAWGIIYLGDNKGVLGIHSLSTAVPIKMGNFPSRFQVFNGKQKISDWVFTFDGQAPLPPGQQQNKPGQGNPLGQQTPGGQATPPSLFNPTPGTQTGTPSGTPDQTPAPLVPTLPEPPDAPASDPATAPAVEPTTEPATEPPPEPAAEPDPAEPAPAEPPPTDR